MRNGKKINFNDLFTFLKTKCIFIQNIMAKSQDAKKNVKKEATKTTKEKKAEKNLKKAAKA